ncbi:nitroreductase/quinone reductase family protein [Cellulomonas sp. ATA003]|uniref:nitroreductase/quinone reductase family protein n=1 Tax=Cellulomonas sp. ATA003 TaxID=3073064 RepID=UPI002873EB83|nr:nitroreductase/quinone reductase family protein [Cellulomonas sp. ATA003]WNB87091.1 nitroreductase/quinone reductase family protein [Cellulomonas sp. ATA003]
MSADQDQTRKVAELLEGQRIAMLTTRALDGTLTSRPMALQEVEFDGDLWFFSEADARKLTHVAADPQVNVTVGSGASWVSLTGTARVVRDDAKKRELWNAGVEAWFGDAEPESPGVALLHVEATSAEYWDSPAAGSRRSSASSRRRRPGSATPAGRTSASTSSAGRRARGHAPR